MKRQRPSWGDVDQVLYLQRETLEYMGCSEVTMGVQHGSAKVRAELTTFVLAGGRVLIAMRQAMSMVRRREFRSLFEIKEFVTAHFVDR